MECVICFESLNAAIACATCSSTMCTSCTLKVVRVMNGGGVVKCPICRHLHKATPVDIGKLLTHSNDLEKIRIGNATFTKITDLCDDGATTTYVETRYS